MTFSKISRWTARKSEIERMSERAVPAEHPEERNRGVPIGQDSGTIQPVLSAKGVQFVLEGEGRLRKLISRGAPLTHVLDALCASLNLQVDNVVSLVLFSDDEEHCRHTIEQYAAHYGLFVFCCTAILSPSEELLGTFEVYCCFP